ncbi:winged helix-turn-helix transcriptional regulator [Salsuginibacillus kocurii]|uniref:winged helix-turn-helix transcriptional regulator n=1 Tax=Salsuginibacillus kocurii TaxID=427078 RepID=UPI0003717A73|nr:helix-turn-helix domain-containing protein [Salsuginibacillus kocurii]
MTTKPIYIKTTLDVVCGKWKAVILMELVNGPLRFAELKRKLPQIHHQTLIKQLKELQEDGLIERKSYAEIPPKVEYKLTSHGESLHHLLHDMAAWGEYHLSVQKPDRYSS